MNSFINEMKMDGELIKLITPIQVVEVTSIDGLPLLHIPYQRGDGGKVYIPITQAMTYNILKHNKQPWNRLQSTLGVGNRLKNEIPLSFFTAAETSVAPQGYQSSNTDLAHLQLTDQEEEFIKKDLKLTDILNKVDLATSLLPPTNTDPTITYDQTRSLPIVTKRVPNPHTDKVLLTEDELTEVLLWAAEAGRAQMLPPDTYVNGMINTSPDSAIAKLAAFLATIVYGENNYIGPEKTGDIGPNKTLLEVVTTVPALSEADAQARAHDIALSVTRDPAVDVILPPLAQAAQVFRPYLEPEETHQAPMTLAGRPYYPYVPEGFTNRGTFNFDLLKLAGDVEQNPGPPKKYSTAAAAEEAALYGNPSAYATYLNNQGSKYAMLRMWINHRAQLLARGQLDNVTDQVRPDDGLCQFPTFSFLNVATGVNQQITNAQSMYRYGIKSDEARANLVLGSLGKNLDASLNTFSDLLSLQRTASNALQGNPELQIFTRTPSTDFGCFLPFLKMILYEMFSAPLTGDRMLEFTGEVMVKNSQAYAAPAAGWPNTDNFALAAGLPVMNAWAIGPPQIAAILLGNTVAFPAGWPGLNDPNTAYVVCSDEMLPHTLTYTTICHMEWPMIGPTTRVFTDSCDGLAFVRTQSAGTVGDYRTRNLIDGPKTNVVFILTGTSEVPNLYLDDGVNGPLVPIPIWVPGAAAAPAATPIQAPMWSYATSRMIGQPTNVFSRDFEQAASFQMRFMSVEDWRAAMSLAGTIINTIGKFQRLRWNDTVANSGSIITHLTPPALDASVNTTQSINITGAQQTTIINYYRANTQEWNDRFMHTIQSVRPAAGAARPQIPYCAWLQDTPWLTKYGIFKKYLAKTTIAETNLATYFKFGHTALFFCIQDAVLHRTEMLHNLVQGMGLSLRDVTLVAPRVVDRRVQNERTIRTVITGYDKMMAGWNFITYMPLMPLLAAPPVPPAGAPNTGFLGAAFDWYLDSPLYFHNPFLLANSLGPDMGLYPKTDTVIVPQSIHGDWEVSRTNPVNWYGIATGGISVMVKPGNMDGGRHAETAKKMYSAMKTTTLMNPGVATALTTVFTASVGAPQKQAILWRSPTMYTYTGDLRWASDNFDNAAIVGYTRKTLFTLPFFPPALDQGQGLLLQIHLNSAPDVTTAAGSLSLRGIGSATYAKIGQNTGDGIFDISSEYADMFKVQLTLDQPKEGPPPKKEEN